MRNFQGYFYRTLQDLKLQTKVLFQVLEFSRKNPGHQEAWEPRLQVTLQYMKQSS